MKKKYHGVVVPVITPLTEERKLDHEAVERIFINFRNCEAMPFICGTTGESASLSMKLKKEYIKLAGRLRQKGDIYYAGIASNCVEESIELAKYSFDEGIDVVAANLPSYYTLTENQMLTYYEQLASNIPGPLIIYNIPSTTHMSVPVELIDKLSHHPNIAGTKDSERSEERLEKSLELWAGREDFSYFLGWAAQSAECLLNGGDGLIPSTGNLNPAIYQELYRAALAGDRENAMRLQKESDRLGNLYQAGRTLGESLWALKELMRAEGLCQNYMMPPLTGPITTN